MRDLSVLSVPLDFPSTVPDADQWNGDLQQTWDAMLAADHLVFVHPLWWGTMPAKLKALFDQILVPGKAYQYRRNTAFPDGLLAGRTAEVIMLSDTPRWYYRLGYNAAQTKLMRNQILKFVGLKPLKFSHISPIRKMDAAQRAEILNGIEQAAERFTAKKNAA